MKLKDYICSISGQALHNTDTQKNPMYLIPIAWLYVVLMMAVAEATNTTGTILGAIITFVLYGLGPVALVVYLMGFTGRRRALKAREAAEWAAYRERHQAADATSADPQARPASSGQPDAGGHAAAHPIAPVREEP
jgi:hypothetical protein